MKEKTKEKIKTIRINLFKRIYNISGCVLWLLLITSIIIELINGGSIFRSVLKCMLPVSSFINLNAIGNVCESLGISSILIVWLYSSLDKTELGIKYIEILKRINKHFYLYTLSHVFSILMGIWSSKTSSLEIGALSLFIVIWSSCIHLYFIYKITFNSDCRKNIVKNKWIDDIQENKNTNYIKVVYNLMEAVEIKNNIDTKEVCRIVAVAFTEMPKKGIDNILTHYQAMWAILLEKQTKEKQSIIINYIFEILSQEKTEYKYICASYIVWLYKTTLSKTSPKSKHELSLLEIQTYLDTLPINLQIKSTDFYNNLYACFYIMMWLIFFEYKINLNSWMLKRSLSTELPAETKDKKFILEIAKSLDVDEKIIDICIKQLY